MSLKRRSPSRDDIVAYIQATLFQGKTKADAYREFINPDIKNVTNAVYALEKRSEFVAVYQTLNSDGNLELQEMALRLKKKYGKMIERNIDTATELLDEAETNKDKATAVRLVNETVGAMAVIQGPGQSPSDRSKLNRGDSVVV